MGFWKGKGMKEVGMVVKENGKGRVKRMREKGEKGG